MPGVHTKKAHSYCIFKLKWILLTLAHLLRFRFKSKYTSFLQKAARRILGFGFWKALKASFVSAT